MKEALLGNGTPSTVEKIYSVSEQEMDVEILEKNDCEKCQSNVSHHCDYREGLHEGGD